VAEIMMGEIMAKKPDDKKSDDDIYAVHYTPGDKIGSTVFAAGYGAAAGAFLGSEAGRTLAAVQHPIPVPLVNSPEGHAICAKKALEVAKKLHVEEATAQRVIEQNRNGTYKAPDAEKSDNIHNDIKELLIAKAYHIEYSRLANRDLSSIVEHNYARTIAQENMVSTVAGAGTGAVLLGAAAMNRLRKKKAEQPLSTTEKAALVGSVAAASGILGARVGQVTGAIQRSNDQTTTSVAADGNAYSGERTGAAIGGIGSALAFGAAAWVAVKNKKKPKEKPAAGHAETIDEQRTSAAEEAFKNPGAGVG
jgi:hypothetical protein